MQRPSNSNLPTRSSEHLSTSLLGPHFPGAKGPLVGDLSRGVELFWVERVNCMGPWKGDNCGLVECVGREVALKS